ncbi:MAG: four helix bundle protein [Syntrophobacteraceae bacterium]|jgi:four helix bundle protein|nr:four helix bundle protein [Syntrophobacteraceae bacterium]
MKISRFEDLDCWQEARILVKKIYESTKNGNFKKDLRLTGQIQGGATSCMADIAEGFTRCSDKEFIQFLYIAMASTAEVQSHLYVVLDQASIAKDQFDEIYRQADKTGKMVSNLIKYLRNSQTRPTK